VGDEEEVERAIAEASALFDDGRWGEAEAAYLRCEALLSAERSPRRAEVLVCLAGIAQRRDSLKDASSYLDLALAIFPAHRAAVAQRLAIAKELEEHAIAAAVGLRSFRFAENDEQRLHVLDDVVREALASASSALRAALQIKRGDRGLLERVRAIHEAAGEFVDAVNVSVSLAETEPDPAARARAFVSAADLCGGKAGNVDRAVALYEAAIADDPTTPGAFEAIEKVLLDSGDVEGTERAYVRQIERLSARNERRAQSALIEKLATIREDRLADFQGAAAALDQLVALRPTAMEPRMHLARILEENGQEPLAARCLEIASRIAPNDPASYRALARIAARQGEHDRAFNVSSVLVHLGEADEEEQALYRAHAPRFAQNPTRALDDSAFVVLRPEDEDAIVRSIFTAVASAAVSARLDALKAKKLLPKLDPKEKQDLERSTVSAVRTVGWAARMFGLRTPDVYARPGDPSGLVALPSHEPAYLLGDGLLSGRTVPELAFLLGYELAQARTVDRLLAFYPTLNDLKAVVVAAIALVVASELPPEIAALRDGIGARLDATRRSELQTAVRALTQRGGQLDVLAFVRSLERTACRAGLLACGDLTVATRLVSIDSHSLSGGSARERVHDLIGFAISEPYTRLRAALGIAVP
jgi:tetratricopeptide (TPR) repeat protein